MRQCYEIDQGIEKKIYPSTNTLLYEFSELSNKFSLSANCVYVYIGNSRYLFTVKYYEYAYVVLLIFKSNKDNLSSIHHPVINVYAV